MEVASIILAGGKGTRLGRDKVVENIFDTTLLERAVNCLSVDEGEIIVVTSKEKSLSPFSGYRNLKIITDIYPGIGPLGGIHSGLKASSSFYNLVVACDMPFLNRALLSHIIKRAEGFDVAIPRINGMVEPLHAVYSRDCLIPIEHLIEQGRRSILDLFPLVKVKYLETEEIDIFDHERMSFFNINTRDDFEKAKQYFYASREKNKLKFLV